MECYLDNAATTQALPEVCEAVTRVMREDYGNPSSLHMKGVEGERCVREAAEQVAKTLKCRPKNIIFTSGGTESNNMALLGVAEASRREGKHIITTCFEHPSVHEPLIFLESQGYEVTYLPVNSQGHVELEALRDALRQDTVLVSVMMVNNEVGSLLDVAELSKLVKEYRNDIVFHVDAIQAYGKMKIQPKRMGVDLMSVSGHKIHGPKGIGFLYRADGVKMKPLMHGGGQQAGMRSGTENVPGIVGLGLAAEIMDKTLMQRSQDMYRRKQQFIELLAEVPGATVNACQGLPLEETAPHVLSVSFDGVRSEVLLHALEEKQIYVSSGSACSSNHPGISGTLKAIGVSEALLDSTLRFSFSAFTQPEEIEYTVECLKSLVPELARYRRM